MLENHNHFWAQKKPVPSKKIEELPQSISKIIETIKSMCAPQAGGGGGGRMELRRSQELDQAHEMLQRQEMDQRVVESVVFLMEQGGAESIDGPLLFHFFEELNKERDKKNPHIIERVFRKAHESGIFEVCEARDWKVNRNDKEISEKLGVKSILLFLEQMSLHLNKNVEENKERNLYFSPFNFFDAGCGTGAFLEFLRSKGLKNWRFFGYSDRWWADYAHVIRMFLIDGIRNTEEGIIFSEILAGELLDLMEKKTHVFPKLRNNLYELPNILRDISPEKDTVGPFSNEFMVLFKQMQNKGSIFVPEPEQIQVYARLPSYPQGVFLGDFEDMPHIVPPECISAGVSVRSSSHLEDNSYQMFVESVLSKLEPGGVFIDDGMRSSYKMLDRFEFLRRIPRVPGTKIMVITKKDDKHPKSVLLMREPFIIEDEELVLQFMPETGKIETLDEICARKDVVIERLLRKAILANIRENPESLFEVYGVYPPEKIDKIVDSILSFFDFNNQNNQKKRLTTALESGLKISCDLAEKISDYIIYWYGKYIEKR